MSAKLKGSAALLDADCRVNDACDCMENAGDRRKVFKEGVEVLWVFDDIFSWPRTRIRIIWRYPCGTYMNGSWIQEHIDLPYDPF